VTLRLRLEFSLYDDPVTCNQCTTRILIIDFAIFKGYIFCCSQCLILIYRNLNHTNIVKLLGVSLDRNPFYIVTEFCTQVSHCSGSSQLSRRGFQLSVVKPKPKLSLWSVKKNSDNSLKQSKLDAITLTWREARKNICLQVAISFGLTSDWSRKCREFTFKPITKRGNVNQTQMRITFDTHVKAAPEQPF